MKKENFPKNFLWGAATSSYQIEGHPLADGAGMSIWHQFSHTPSNVCRNDTGDIACDHYNRYKEDVKIIKKLGIKAYRFSISWPRIFPDGIKNVNLKGVDFYDKLIDELLENNITPFLTVYHWDLPANLQDKGGWSNDEIALWFGEYAHYLYKKFKDRVKYWITLNEPWVTAFAGHLYGIHAPGIRNVYTSFHVIHNELKAHCQAVKAFKEENIDGKIGVALSNRSQKPASNNEKDVKAALAAHAWRNYPLFLNPIFRGKYHENVLKIAKGYLPKGFEKDAENMVCPLDFVGINYYSGGLVKYDSESLFGFKFVGRGLEKTKMGWEIYPKGLYDILTSLQEDYNPPEIFITENGAAFTDRITGKEVHDPDRIKFLKSHLEQALYAIKSGVRLKGYFVWSLLDNFEWEKGYSKRFGIVYVNYKNQKRIVKDSGKWYSEVIQKNSL